MASAGKKTKKRNFLDCEIEVLVGEVEKRKKILFGGHSMGVTNAKKTLEWQTLAEAVNATASEDRTVAELKKKWSDIKVEAKKRLAHHRQSVSATGGGKGTPELTPLDERLAGIIGESLLSGVVTEAEGDTDVPADEMVAACSSGEGGAAEPPRASPSPSPSPSPSSSGRVLTDAVLAMQRETIQCIREVAGELKAIKTVLSEMSKKMK
ncbi:nuclear apoptosis-inducing factor 1-like [Hypomesus transpacificus]|uniref:nuclear apoptosis-inducing factor 1-like n=1 Tax=Hypomesus transpacificus TaxID=137520 RepID=UPI001F078B42|nr:nuclear apoptosis-inducing factor 1-like [Hypomesus transpacificus]XP_046874029.1 nuclear apoptosis-inducing factor 1-like [Hypomesus transpacificus]XP_046874257.1 nuclear apoptosis-inducing factor 1-like [Hypomesus transpacificus]XP_046887027.1 nuclear apoptosis-inducing factor 1-like [Hypomesus transpacificus]